MPQTAGANQRICLNWLLRRMTQPVFCNDSPDWLDGLAGQIKQAGLQCALNKPVAQISTDLMCIVNDDQLFNQALRIEVKDIDAIETDLAAITQYPVVAEVGIGGVLALRAVENIQQGNAAVAGCVGQFRVKRPWTDPAQQGRVDAGIAGKQGDNTVYIALFQLLQVLLQFAGKLLRFCVRHRFHLFLIGSQTLARMIVSGISTNSEEGDAEHAYPLATLTRPLPSMMGLQAFVAVAKLGSLTRAARQLCRTQGAVSRQIQQLEQFYQQPLFQRTPSGMSMTPYGERLYVVANKALGSLSGFSCHSPQQPDRFRLRLPSTFALRWFLPRLAAIQRCLPAIQLEISTTVIDKPEFGTGDFDAMIVRGHGQWPGLRSELLFAEQLTPMCSAELSMDLPQPAELAQQRLIHANGSQQEWQAWWQAYATGPMPGQQLYFDSLDAAVNAAAQGYGIALADPRLFQDQLGQGALVMPFPQWCSGEYGYYLVHPASAADLSPLRLLAATLHSLLCNTGSTTG